MGNDASAAGQGHLMCDFVPEAKHHCRDQRHQHRSSPHDRTFGACPRHRFQRSSYAQCSSADKIIAAMTKAKVYGKTGKGLRGMVNEGFCPHGQKTPPPKNAVIENGNNLRRKAENQVWHVSCIRCFHGESFQHIEFASRHFAKRTRRQHRQLF